MSNEAQVECTGCGYRIIASYTPQQLNMIYKFLAPEPEGRGYFDNFVLNNSSRNSYWQLSTNAQSEKKITDPLIFDLWYLMTITLAEVCGCNRNCILFDMVTPKSTEKLDPNSVEINKTTFDQMACQLIKVIRSINKEIPIVSNNFMLMNNGPRIIP